jgi:hypothetical protein
MEQEIPHCVALGEAWALIADLVIRLTTRDAAISANSIFYFCLHF